MTFNQSRLLFLLSASLRRKPSTASSKESRQRKGSMDKSFTTSVPQLPSSLPQQQHSLLQQKHHMISSPSLSKPSRRPSLPFSQTTISLPDHDGTTPLLKRSNTMPLKRVNNKNTEQGKERYILHRGSCAHNVIQQQQVCLRR